MVGPRPSCRTTLRRTGEASVQFSCALRGVVLPQRDMPSGRAPPRRSAPPPAPPSSKITTCGCSRHSVRAALTPGRSSCRAAAPGGFPRPYSRLSARGSHTVHFHSWPLRVGPARSEPSRPPVQRDRIAGRHLYRDPSIPVRSSSRRARGSAHLRRRDSRCRIVPFRRWDPGFQSGTCTARRRIATPRSPIGRDAR